MKVLIGNLFESSMKTLVNTVNCVGVMGKGIAQEFKKRYPDMYKQYVALCDAKELSPGKPYYYQDLLGSSILLFPTKDHWRSPSQLQYITEGLNWFVDHYQLLGITSIAFPPLGCGNGGLSWDVVGPVMYQKLISLPIDIEIYAPYGTNVEQLKPEYLSRTNMLAPDNVKGVMLNTVNPKWFLILEVVKRINEEPYALRVGRVALQKICYILTRCGVATDFSFVRGAYGPYSKQVKDAITALSNANLIYEHPAPEGKLIEVRVSQDFALDNGRYTAIEHQAVTRCTDLFCRIKNAMQAEMIATVIYEYDEQKKTQNTVSEQNLLEGVLRWEKKWVDVKEDDVRRTIRNLGMLQWIHPTLNFEFNELY